MTHIIVLFFLVYFVSIYLRNRRLNKGTSNSRVHYAFKYIIKVAKNCGIDVSYTSYSELKEKLINNSKFANKDNISAVFNVVLKSGFAGGEISQQEIEFVISSAKNYAKAAHKSLIWYKKFSFRYIKHLI